MKILLKSIFILCLLLIVFGYIMEARNTNGKLFIGIGVFIFAFLFLPLFIYLRYKDRVGSFIDERMQHPEDSKKE